MASQYMCGSPQRRTLVQGSPLNGIDFLEVLDAGLPTASRQRTLLLQCFKPVTGLTAANVRIVGGVRVTGIRAEWAYPGDAVPTSVLPDTAPERPLIPASDKVLVVRVNTPGDFSPYKIQLSHSSTSFVPAAGFDQKMAEVAFSFKADCPSDFDCEHEAAAEAPSAEQPLLDYLVKDYQGFRRLMLDRLATSMPDWKTRTPADLGVAVVEVLAYAADHLSYYQDAVATEAYLGTAHQRSSVRRHARLLDYPMHDGCNARTFVCVEVTANGVLLPKSTPFLTPCTNGPSADPAEVEQLLLRHGPEVFEAMETVTLYPAHNRIRLYTWGEEACILPAGATRATLWDDAANRVRLCPGDVLIFEEVLGPRTGLSQDADPTRRHAVRLTRVTPEAKRQNDGTGARTPAATPLKDALFTSPERLIVEIEWAAEDGLPFPFHLSTVVGGTVVSDVTVARGNVVPADHGRTVQNQALTPAEAPASGPYRPVLKGANLTFAVPYDPGLHVTDPATGLRRVQPAVGLLQQDPRQALPAVALEGTEETWSVQRDLLGSDRFAREFVVETESSGTTRLRFGDGMLGQRPNPGEALAATYRVGNGTAGNVGAEAVAHVVTAEHAAIHAVRNPLPARGGIAPESLEEVRQYAPAAFRTQERAVTEADYAAVVQRHPEVNRAAATLRWTGSWHTMFVTVERRGGRPVDEAFRLEIQAFLERYRLAGYDLAVDAPRYVPLDIALNVCAAPGHYQAEVRRALVERFGTGNMADGHLGFFHPDNWTFGQPVYLSQIIAAAMQVPGVKWVDSGPGSQHRFQRWGHTAQGELQDGKITLGRLEIARCDNDLNVPENGRMIFRMRGGL